MGVFAKCSHQTIEGVLRRKRDIRTREMARLGMFHDAVVDISLRLETDIEPAGNDKVTSGSPHFKPPAWFGDSVEVVGMNNKYPEKEIPMWTNRRPTSSRRLKRS